MAEYVTVSICEDCKIVFPNSFMKVKGNYKQQAKNIQGCVATKPCPECGKEITTLVDTGYWVQLS